MVPLYIQWGEPRLFPHPPIIAVMVPPQSVCPSAHPPGSPQPGLPAAFSHAAAPGREARQTDGRQSKDSISYTNNSSMLLDQYLPKKQKRVTVSHQEVSSALQDSEGKYSSGSQSV